MSDLEDREPRIFGVRSDSGSEMELFSDAK